MADERSLLTRRGFLRATGVAPLAGAATSPEVAGGVTVESGGGRPGAEGAPAAQRAPALPPVGADTLATGFAAPVAIVPVPGRDGTFLVADQPGVVSVVTEADGRREAPLLDLREGVVGLERYDERGLLGIALHPSFPDDGRLFVRYSSPPRAGTPEGYDHTFVLAEVPVTVDPLSATAEDERVLMEIPEPQSNHNGGDIAFGPDGLLYVSVGDGGGDNDEGDGHVEDWYAPNAGGNGQDVTENLLGSILRIDVDQRRTSASRTDSAAVEGDSGRPYGIPEDNPLVGEAGLDEHYAWGFRNPWRISFSGGELFVADAGQRRFEEVDLVERGGNYGWNVLEGTHCLSPSGEPPDSCPGQTTAGEALIGPIIEYDHEGEFPSGVAVIGGYLYEGDQLPGLRGRYVFADWVARGQLFVADRPDDGGLWPVSPLPVESSSSAFGTHVLSFGQDHAGELLACTSEESSPSGSTGAVHRLVPAGTTETESPEGTTTGTRSDAPVSAGTGSSEGATNETWPGDGPLFGIGLTTLAVSVIYGAYRFSRSDRR